MSTLGPPGGGPGTLNPAPAVVSSDSHWAPPHVPSSAGPRPGDEKQSAAELDLVLQRQQHLQEKLAEEMLGLARSLKTNTLAAQSVIKMDNQVRAAGPALSMPRAGWRLGLSSVNRSPRRGTRRQPGPCSCLPQTLSHSLKMADQNLEKLKTESERLEQHAQKSVNWLLWAMLVVVCFIFISMILFIRIVPKLK